VTDTKKRFEGGKMRKRRGRYVAWKRRVLNGQ